MTPADVHTAILTALHSLARVTVYDGDVHPTPPTDQGGRVLPYLLVTTSPGTDLDPTLHGTPSGSSSAITSVQCVAGSPTMVLHTADLVRSALAGLRHNTGMTRATDTPTPVLIDRAVTPARFYAPLQFRTTLT